MDYDSIVGICKNTTSANPELKGPDLFDAIVVELMAAGVTVDVEGTNLLRETSPDAVAVLVDKTGGLELLDTWPDGKFEVRDGGYDASKAPDLLSEQDVFNEYIYDPDAPTAEDLGELRCIIRGGLKYYESDFVYSVYASKVIAREARYAEQRNTTISLPDEFLLLCDKYGLTPLDALEGFVADVCSLQSYVSSPRPDGYCSNGSDERDMARAYFDRAYWPLKSR